MATIDIHNYFNKHCKVVLNGGKQVYGVLLQGEVYDAPDDLYFVSVGLFKRLERNQKAITENAYRLKIKDVVRAEIIEEQAGVNVSMAA